MGVRGLTSFLSHDPTVWTPLPKSNLREDGTPTQVVIDGPALVFHIQCTNKIEWRYDGDYKRFAQCVRDYFTALTKSGFSTFVVINGLANESKIDNHVARENDALQRVSRLIVNPTDLHTHKGKELLPKLAFQTFMQVVKEQKVPHVVCDGDAERTMAWMARTRGSAVVSNDSDCFIVENKNGFIQLDSLRVSPAGITGRMFRRDKLAELLGVPVSLLPLFAALVGNDHATDAELRRLQRLIYNKYQASTPGATPDSPQPRGGTLNYKHGLIRAIGAFLAAHPSEEAALAEASAMLSVPPEPKPKAMWGDDDDADGPPGLYEPVGLDARSAEDCEAEAKRVCEILVSAQQRYLKVPAGEEKRDYLGTKGTELVPSVPSDWEGGAFPDQLVQAFRAGDFDWKCMLALCRRTFWGHTVIENVFERPSVYLLPRPLRQLTYGMLFRAPAEGADDITVKEYLRLGDSLHFGPEDVSPLRTAPSSGVAVPHLSEVFAMGASERRALLLGCLGLPAQGSPVTSLPLPFLLPVCLVRWWLANDAQPVSLHSLIAVLSCLVANEDSSSHRMPLRFSRHAAHVCSTWSALIEAGNMLCTALMLPVPAITAPLACDGALVHIMCDQLRRSSAAAGAAGADGSAPLGSVQGARDPHGIISSLVSDVEPLWMIYTAATAGLEDRIDGELSRGEGGRLEITRQPVTVESNGRLPGAHHGGPGGAQHGGPNNSRGYPQRGVLGHHGNQSPYGGGGNTSLPGGGLGGHHQHAAESERRRKEEEELLSMVKPGYDAGIKKTNIVRQRESKVQNAFAGLGGDDGDDGEESESESEEAQEPVEQQPVAPPVEEKPKGPEKTGDEDIDALLEDLSALDEVKDKKKQKQKEKAKNKKKGKK